MRWNNTHLTYCMNIHPSETWGETINAINTYARAVKEQICPDKSFSLGLRLSNRASIELEPQVQIFKEYLARIGMYVVTINGFPYGPFHGTPLKENVYYPDWSQPERVTYTKRLARILAPSLPEGVNGTISTLPICYGKCLPAKAIDNIFDAAGELARIEAETGKTIILALEPEPDCYLESITDVLNLWNDFRSHENGDLCKFLGICLDTSHILCEFEDPTDFLLKMKEAGIQVPKIQISNILRVLPEHDHVALLKPYLDKVYLHQTRVLSKGKALRFPDLNEALNEHPSGEWRVHFHVPLYFKGPDRLETTSSLLEKDFFKESLIPDKHIEIETYSLNVMPGRPGNIVKSICNEFKWLINTRNRFEGG